MSQATFGSPILYLNNKEIPYDSISYNNDGSNKATRIQVSTGATDLSESKLFGSKVKLYLNAGSLDDVPFFIGIIRQVSPSDKKVSFTALDVLGLLGGKQAGKLQLTDTKNYDGYTIGQFLQSYIEEFVNIKETLIGLDMLNDSYPAASLTNIRGDFTPLSLVSKVTKLDTTNLKDIKSYRVGVINDAVKSNIVFFKEQSLDDSGIIFNLNKGIRNISYNVRNPPNLITGKAGDLGTKYVHNTAASGTVVKNKNTPKGFKDPADFHDTAFYVATKEESVQEISITVDKGYYLDIGNVISIQIPSFPEVNGKHRIMAKTLNISKAGLSCTLKLNKELPQVENYLSSGDVRNFSR